jgi:hypothetical protein
MPAKVSCGDKNYFLDTENKMAIMALKALWAFTGSGFYVPG